LSRGEAGKDNGRAEVGPIVPGRLILLGASNVAMGFPNIVSAARTLWGGPLDLLAAFGHGRSYGQRMPLFWRELPGIAECGLWQALEQRPPCETLALVTDVGNDLMYEFPVADIASWVEVCLDRLQRAGARVVLTALPLCSVTGLSARRFLFFRSILFPWSRLKYETILGWAHDLDARLRRLAAERGVVVAEPRREWYGLDPIHIRRSRRRLAWTELLARGAGVQPSKAAPALPLARSLRLRLLRPECRWVFGREQHTVQPAGRLEDGTTIALY
jgi:hypothetical protein